MEPLKRRLVEDRVIIGSWITLAHPSIAEIMARAGFDWLAVDLEHSVITIREAEELIRVIELCGVTPLVRLTSNNPDQIKRVMDSGAHGVIVPMVNTRQEAEQAVEAVKYPPAGKRGVGLARAQGYGARFDKYTAWVERESIVIVQIEHIKAVKNLDDILSAEGVDGFIVGPYDLSGSLGVPGQFEHPAMVEVLQEIQLVADRRKAVAGYHVVPPRPDLVIQKIQEGYRFIAYSLDMLFLGEMCRRGLQEIKNHIR
ncbi:aldolase/citrate lyase family protein [Nitrospiraceae bacterium AH_259_D15_M11_P09]|nr:aldolase/citrate lyase family protein [Nitrospiraceae bacterium AH_259_D15_M11_P09]